MAETAWATLCALLADRYEEFKGRLARQLGSEELASESLHEAWLQLQRRNAPERVERPAAFLMHITTNIARDALRRERRLASRSEVDAVVQLPDPAPNPASAAEARLDLQLVAELLEGLPSRTREILLASRLEGLSHQAIADRLGVSRRTVLYELKRAVEYLDAGLDRSVEDPSRKKTKSAP